jgi:hypothetical protein
VVGLGLGVGAGDDVGVGSAVIVGDSPTVGVTTGNGGAEKVTQPAKSNAAIAHN